jgi:hypothetical protein
MRRRAPSTPSISQSKEATPPSSIASEGIQGCNGESGHYETGIDPHDELQLCDTSFKKWHDIRTIQKLLGHRNFQTTMIYTHVATKNILGVRSPLDK